MVRLKCDGQSCTWLQFVAEVAVASRKAYKWPTCNKTQESVKYHHCAYSTKRRPNQWPLDYNCWHLWVIRRFWKAQTFKDGPIPHNAQILPKRLLFRPHAHGKQMSIHICAGSSLIAVKGELQVNSRIVCNLMLCSCQDNWGIHTWDLLLCYKCR